MHCPDCGAKTSPEHRFCRSCGLSLEPFARLLAEHLPAETEGGAEAETTARLMARQRKVERWLGVALWVFLGSIAVGTLYSIIAKVIIGKGQLLYGLIFLGVILVGVASVALVAYRETLKEKMEKRRPAELQGEGAATRSLPDARFEPAASVTDRTTELLAARREGTPQS
jgi:hypothetical protein